MRKIIRFFLFTMLLYLLSPFSGGARNNAGHTCIYIFAVAFLTAYLITPLARQLGSKLGIMDVPNERKIHSEPIASSGGIAIFAGYFTAIIRNMHITNTMTGVILATSVIFIIGVLDDIREIPATVKLVFQILATAILVLFGIKVSVFPYGWYAKDMLDLAVTFIGVVGITNSFNYMDGMNGEASGLAFISSSALFLIALAGGDLSIMWLSIALAGCCLGFLPHNFPKARIFMGDSGATTIGFLLAAIAVAGTWNASNAYVASVIPVLIFSVYIFDMVYTTLSRIKNGSVKNIKQWLEVTGTDHFHHRLVNLGFTRVEAVIFIWVCAAIFSFSAYVIRDSSPLNVIVILIQSFFIYLIAVVLMLIGKKNRAEGDERRA